MVTRFSFISTLLIQTLLLPSALASPQQDLQTLRNDYQQIFPQLQLQDYADGVYAIDPIARASWQAINEFPPYEPALDKGKELFEAAFGNGHHYVDCFNNKGIAIAQNYPRWDKKTASVITLALAINNCRLKHKEVPLSYKLGAMADILAYMAFTSQGKIIAIHIPKDDPRALAAYQQGKDYYYQRRGQLNFACASCHMQNAGKKIRAEVLSPMLGHTSHWPVYRLKWGSMGTLHRRFIGCHKQIRAALPTAQSEPLRNLEYFMSYISNGIAINGPGVRK